jgi:NADH:ubiquinone oxidoreductase subunit 4 (subunit M)
MPLFSVFFLIFTMGNLSLPGTSSFVGEFLILVGVFQTNPFVATFAATGMILGGAYSIWLYNRVVFGNLKPFFIDTFMDVNRREFFIFLPFVFCVLWMGFYPEVFLEPMHTSVANLVQHGQWRD